MSQAADTVVASQAGWRHEITPGAWRALIAAFLGWALDIMDLMLFSFVMVKIMAEFGLNPGYAGIIAAGALLAGACGGWFFGMVADRFGRIRSMVFSILLYSIATFACGLSQGMYDLLLFRVLVGLGMGGEYAAGAALVTETWPAKYRTRAMSVVQMGFGFGFLAAGAIAALVEPAWGWRAVFFVGVLPAILVFFIRRHTPESQLWQKHNDELKARGEKYSAIKSLRSLLSTHRKNTIGSLAFITCIMLGYWALFMWAPAYMAMPVEQGGRGLSIVKSSLWVMLMQSGCIPGFLVFGWLADKIKLKPAFAIYTIGNVIIIPIFLMTDNITLMLCTAPFTGFFSALMGGFGPMLAEMFPTEVRATATGAIYNTARGLSGSAPMIIGGLALSLGVGTALLVAALAYALAMVVLFFLPPLKSAELK